MQTVPAFNKLTLAFMRIVLCVTVILEAVHKIVVRTYSSYGSTWRLLKDNFEVLVNNTVLFVVNLVE